MTAPQTITLSRTLASTIAGVALLSAFCAAALVASFVVNHQGGDGSPYLDFAGRFVSWIGLLATAGVGGHSMRHIGSAVKPGQDP